MKTAPKPHPTINLTQGRLDAERWLDEGGSFRPEAMPSAPTGNEPPKVIDARSAKRYQCSCRHVFQVFGLDRHRRYYELSDLCWENPVMGRVCPACQSQLPGKN